MNIGQTPLRVVYASAALVSVFMITGCGAAYRSVITPISSTGPAAQASALAVVVSSPSDTSDGVVTIINYSGDSIMATQAIGLGPVAFAVDAGGYNGYTINSNGTLNNFPISSSLQAKNIGYSTLTSDAEPIGVFAPKTGGLWAPDLNGDVVDIFTGSSGSVQTFLQSLPVEATPILVVGQGTSSAQRNFAISQGNVTSGVECNQPSSTSPLGWVTPIETSIYTADTPIQVGRCPVYALLNSESTRLFVLNRGSDTISVINTQDNTLDACTPFTSQTGRTVTCHPTLPLSLSAVTSTGITPPNTNGTSGMTTTAGPVYAEYNTATQQLVVANYDGSTISIIDVSLDEYGNDSDTFGYTYTVSVGNNPASVTVLNDGSRAYTANQTDGTVSIVNMSSHTIEKAAVAVVGHPRSVSSVQNSQYGKVYVASPDSPYLTILSTVNDLVDTTVLVEGNILDVRTNNQNGTSGTNNNATSRRPGYGQPCYMPGSTASASLTACRTMSRD
jgi:DNA-binding beta-propeller fold protein YncE